MSTSEPGYLHLLRNGQLERRALQAAKELENCRLCPRHCGANRTLGATGYCRTGADAVIAGFDAHFGEETPLVGRHGSGTIFFSHCNLLCSFCQNFSISHRGEGSRVDANGLAEAMLELQRMGCHNINLVSPSHVVPQIISGVLAAARKGLRLPLVYNTGGYDKIETLLILEGIIDIYMPDFKFWDEQVARQTCDAPDYARVAQGALTEMHRQVGDLCLDEEGIAVKGLLVRHLVLPCNMSGTKQVMTFIADRLSKNTYVNIMAQYRPCGQAANLSGFSRPITRQEYRRAVDDAKACGIKRLDQRGPTLLMF